jgi:hypothetical protein
MSFRGSLVLSGRFARYLVHVICSFLDMGESISVLI